MDVFFNPITLASLTCVIVMVVLGSLARHPLPGLKLWLRGGFFVLLGLILLGTRGRLPPLISIIFANASFLGGMLLMLAGCRQFFGLRVNWLLVAAILILSVLYNLISLYVYDDLRERLVVYSLINAALAAYLAVTIWRHWPRSRPPYAYVLTFGTAVLILGISIARAIAFGLFIPLTNGSWLVPESALAVTLLALGVAGTALLMICLLLMAHDRLLAELEGIAYWDALTGADSRTAFLGKLERRLNAPHAAPLQVLLLDLDHFKNINDTRGHATGDRVLRHFSQAASALLREHEAIGRMGGEEFAILFPWGGTERAQQFDAQLRRQLDAEPILLGNEPLHYGYSAGAAIARSGDTPEQVLARADRALYDAKHAGRGRLLTSQEPQSHSA